MWKDNVAIDVNVSLADLVNGSFALERGELKAIPPAIEGQATELQPDAKPPDEPK